MINLQLTREEANRLEVYLLVTTRFREGEVEANQKLYKEFKETPSFDEKTVKKFKSNAEFWQNQCTTMDDLQQRLQTLLSSPEQTGKEDTDENQ